MRKKKNESYKIQIKNLHKLYDHGLIHALNGIDLDISYGESVAITGPSGCGKTTLLNLIAGMDIPSEGMIRINNKNILDYKPAHRYRVEYIGYIFQFHNLIPNLTVQENLEIATVVTNVKKNIRKQRINFQLDQLKLTTIKDKLPNFLSGGERQKTAIARAMVNQPPIILAEEPTGCLDTITGNEIIDLLLSFNKVENRILIISTHNREIAKRCDRIISIENGKIK